MKKSVLFLATLVVMNQGFAQEVQELGHQEKEVITQNLEKEADSGKHDHRIKKLLKKVSQAIKDSSQKVVVEVKKLDDCENCAGKPKEQVIVRNIGRDLGKVSAWITTNTSKPFMTSAGFLTGLFEKKDKNKDIVALYQFFLNHSKEFDQLYVEAGTPEDMVELMLGKMEEILEKKTHVILKDFLVSVGIKREIPEDLADFQLTEEEIASIDMDKVSADFINNHAEYAELKPIIGSVSEQELNDFIMTGYFDKSIGFENYKQALPKIHEGALTIVGQIAAPKMVLGLISQSLVGLYATPVIAADIGTGLSTAICLQKETQEKFKADDDLRAFCSYVVNKSSYELMKSRAKGYVSGKNIRAKIEQKLKERKERRAKRRAERSIKNA